MKVILFFLTMCISTTSFASLICRGGVLISIGNQGYVATNPVGSGCQEVVNTSKNDFYCVGKKLFVAGLSDENYLDEFKSKDSCLNAINLSK